MESRVSLALEASKCRFLSMSAKTVTMNLKLWCMEAKKLNVLSAKATSSPQNSRFSPCLRNPLPRAPLIRPRRAHAAVVETPVVPARAPCPILIKQIGLRVGFELKQPVRTNFSMRTLGTAPCNCRKFHSFRDIPNIAAWIDAVVRG